MTIKSLTALFLAATFVGLGGCGQQDNTGQTDDSGMSDTAPGTSGDTSGSASDPYAPSPDQSDDTMTAPPSGTPQSGDMTDQGAGATTAPGTNEDMSTGAQGGATDESSTPPPQQ